MPAKQTDLSLKLTPMEQWLVFHIEQWLWNTKCVLRGAANARLTVTISDLGLLLEGTV